MTTTSDTSQTITSSIEGNNTNSQSSGLDSISIIIIIICCLLIISVTLISLWYWIRNKKLRQYRESQSAEMQKSEDGHEIEVDIKIEQSNPTKLKNTKIKEIKYFPQQDSITKTEDKESSSIYRNGDRSHSMATSRNLLNSSENALGSHKLDKRMLIDFVQDESDIHHVDVSFKGGENDKSMITYEKKIGNLPLNKEITGKQIIENKLYRNSNNSQNEDVEESRFSDDEENYTAENKEDIVRHYEKMSHKMFNYNDEFEIKQSNLNLNSNYNLHQPHNFAHGIDDNQYMTANFVNAIEDFENNIDGGHKNNRSFGKKDSFDKENDRYNNNNLDDYIDEDANKIFNNNSLMDSTSYINKIGNKFSGGK